MPEWIAYVDESGSVHGVRGKPGHLMLACIAGSPGALDDLAERIRRLKLELAPGLDPASWELHAGDMFHNRGGSPLGSLGTEKQMLVMRRIVDIVCGSDAVLFGIFIMGARARGKYTTDTWLLRQAMALLVQRLDLFALELGDGVTLRMVSDIVHEGHRLEMQRALERQPPPRAGARRVTGIRFADSRSSAIIQAADAFAYATNRHLVGDAAFEGMFRDLERKAWVHREQGGLDIGAVRRTQ